jgi:hypothetical protein
LVIAIFSLAYKGHERNEYLPFAMGLVASLMIIVGKFYYENDYTMYVGVILLIISTGWNAWPHKGHVGIRNK